VPDKSGWSLRGRLLALLAGVLCLFTAAGAGFMYYEADQSGQQLHDESLKQTGELLLQLAQHELGEHGPALGVTLLTRETVPGSFHMHYQVWTEDQRAAYRTAQAPEQPFMPLTAEGFGWTRVHGETWRSFAVWSEDHSLQLQIAESQQYRRQLPSTILWRLALALAVLLPLGGLLTWLVIRHSFATVQAAAQAVAARPPSDLSPIEARELPREVMPLVTALDRLLATVREVLANERRFTSDAAHELRTPLAAIRANAQVMQNARTQHELRDAARDLMTGVDRSGRLIEQLLALARLDASGEHGKGFATVDLPALLDSQLQEQQHFAERRGVRLLADAQPARVHGQRDLLSVLLRNLVDNAIRYAGSGTEVTLSCREQGAQVELAVTDTGPGIDPSDRARIFERFFRVDANKDYGSGLGLSIVARIAELHGAQVGVQEGPGGRGARFSVRFTRAS
jgi:two-component system, OmpR family, sensor histidine kinase QseC